MAAMVLGLTGGYCTGKNTVASLLTARGWHCIDVDILGHVAVEESRDALVRRFGPAILRSDGSLDRKALGRIVFAEPAALHDHEAIVHPRMLALLEECLESAHRVAYPAGTTSLACINAAILYRMPQISRCDAVIEVVASQAVRLERAAQRDRLGAADALQRIASQEYLWHLRPGTDPDSITQNAPERSTASPGAWQYRDSKVFFIDNSGNEHELARALDLCLDLIIRYEVRARVS